MKYFPAPASVFRTLRTSACLVAWGTALSLTLPQQADAASFGSGLSGGDFLDGGGQNMFKAPSQDVRDIVENALRTQGEIGAATQVLPEAVEKFPRDRVLKLLLAVGYAVEGRLEDAEGLIEEAKALVGDAAGPAPGTVWLHVAEALIARGQGNLEAAETSIADALLLDPQNAYAYNVAGTIAFANDDLEAAKERFTEAVAFGPDGPVFNANLASILIAQDDIAGARAALAESHARQLAACPTRIVEAGLELSLNRLNAAEAALQACLTSQPENKQALGGLIELALDRADIETAKTLMSRFASDPDFDLVRARIALFEGAPAAARRVLGTRASEGATLLLSVFADAMASDLPRAIKRVKPISGSIGGGVAASAFHAAAGTAPLDKLPPSPAVQFFSALNPEVTDDPMGALNEAEGFEQAFTAAGLDVPANAIRGGAETGDLALGVAYRLWGFHGAAAATLARASDTNPDNPLAAYFAGVAHLKLGDTDKAEAALMRALAAAPNFFVANIAAAELRIRAGAPGDALQLLKAAVAVREDPGALIRIGLIQEALGDDPAAQEAYERFVAVQPDSYIALNQLAWHFARRGIELDRAATLAQRANELQPGNASVLDTLGWIAFLREDGELAVETLREASRIAKGTNPGVDYHLAQAELRFGDAERGQSLLRELVEAGPDAYSFSQEAAGLLATVSE